MDSSSSNTKRWSLKKKLLIAGAVLAGGLLLLGLLLPTIASGMAPGLIASNAQKYLSGTVKAQNVSLSWGGPQKIGPVTVNDAQGQKVATLTVEADKGLLGFATGGLDIGTVTIKDVSANLVRDEKGELNIQKMLKPAPPGKGGAAKPGDAKAANKPAEPLKLPAGLRARIIIKNLEATLVDQSGPGGKQSPTTIALSNVQGEVQVDPSKPLVLKLSAQAQGGANQNAGKPGSINADISAANWANGDGTVVIDAADLKAKVSVKDFPMSVIDAFVGPVLKDQQGNALSIAKALGASANLDIDATGTIKNASAVINATLDGATAQGELRIADNVLTTVKPLAIRVKGAALGGLVPALHAAMDEKAPARITALPDASITVDALRIKIPANGAALDLRGSSAKATLALTETRGTVALAGQPAKEMRIAPLVATLDAPDLAGSVRVTGRTTATLGGAPAGEFDIDATLAGLLDANGAPRQGPPANVQATILAKQIATAIAQPFVQSLGLDLARDIGPTLDVSIRAASAGEPKAGVVPPINIDATIASSALAGNAALTLSPGALTSRDAGVVFEAKSAGKLAEALTKTLPGYRVVASSGAEGRAKISVQGLSLPLAKNNAPRLDAAAMTLVVEADGLALQAPAPGLGAPLPAPINLTRFKLDGGMNAGGNLTLKGDGVLNALSRDMALTIDYRVPTLFAKGDAGKSETLGEYSFAPPLSLRPSGLVQLNGVPTELLRSFMPVSAPVPAKPGEKALVPMDVVAMVRETLGDALRLKLDTREEKDKPDSLAVELVIDSNNLKTIVKSGLTPTELTVRSVTSEGKIAPSAFAWAMQTFAPDLSPRPTLAGASAIKVSTKPLTIPLDKDFKPIFAKAGDIDLTILLPEKTLIEGLVIGQGADAKQVQKAGMEGFELNITCPLTSLVPSEQGGKPGQAKANLKGSLVGPSGVFGSLRGTGDVQLSKGAPSGAIKLDAGIDGVDVKALDAILQRDQFLAAALGDRLGLKLRTDLTAGIKDNAPDMMASRGTVALDIQAPNIKSAGPLSFRLAPEKIELEKPANFSMTLPAALVNTFLASKPEPGKPAQPAALTALGPVNLDLALTRVALPGLASTGAKAPPDIAASLTIPSGLFETAAKSKLNLGSTRLTLNTDKTAPGTPLSFAAIIDSLSVDGGAPSGKVGLEGVVRGLTNAAGAFSMETAAIDAKGSLPAVPTALVDAIANQGGLMVDALGPTVQVDLTVERYPLLGKPIAGLAPGFVDFKAQSERASAAFKGNINDAVLVSTEPVSAGLLEVSKALSGRFVKGLPLVGVFEKSRSDAPAMITATNVSLPLDNDLSKLNATIRIDPGEAKFETSGDFAALLDLVKIKAGVPKQIGRRLEPLAVNVVNGVAKYDRWTLPLGEFSVQSEGTVDLVQKSLDVITWVPLGALTDSTAGLFKGKVFGNNLAGLGAATMVPLRTKGTFEKNSTGPDFDLFLKSVVKSLAPEKVIEKGLDDLLRKALPKKK